jgi:hypothetical protein
MTAGKIVQAVSNARASVTYRRVRVAVEMVRVI